MAIDPSITNNFLDSCAFDPKYAPEAKASLELFELYEMGKVLLQIAHSIQKEIGHPNTPASVKTEAQNLIFTMEVWLTPSELVILRKIEAILAGNGKIENISQDARHVFEAQKYGSYFITTDTGILNRAPALRICCGVEIVRPSEFLAIVETRGR
jgi:hypothetical protein